MKRNAILVIYLMFLTCSKIVLAQVPLEFRDIQIDILRLREYSIKYYGYKEVSDSKARDRKDSVTKKYRDQIHKIKNGPNRKLYLKFLNNAIEEDSSKYKDEIGYNYTYYNPLLTYDRREMPTMLEYFKVVRYCLFEKNKNELVPPDQIPFLNQKARVKRNNQ